MIYLLICLLQMEPVQIISGTETFRPLGMNVTIRDDGNIYLINEKKQVLHINPHGEKVRVFGRQGEGPGEFLAPFYIGSQEDRIWVYDILRGAASFFSLEGELLYIHRSERQEGVRNRPLKTSKGWAFVEFIQAESSPAEILLADESLKTFSPLLTWSPDWMHPQKMAHGLQKRMGVNPALENIHSAISGDGRYLYVSHPGRSFKISVFDTIERKKVHIIGRNEKLVPFNKDWGQNMLKGHKRAGNGVTVKLDAPSSFPLIRSMSVLDDCLFVSMWTWEPDHKARYLVLDHHGNHVDLPFKPENRKRILAIYGKVAWLTGYDDESGEALILKCSKDQIDGVAAEHSILYEKTRKLWVPVKL